MDLLITAILPMGNSFCFFRIQLQVSRRSHEHVWRKPAQHSLQTVPSAPGQPGDHRTTRGWTSHLIYGRHQRYADHAALDGESGTLSVRSRDGRCCRLFTRITCCVPAALQLSSSSAPLTEIRSTFRFRSVKEFIVLTTVCRWMLIVPHILSTSDGPIIVSASNSAITVLLPELHIC